jgi:hypothetical protein
MSLDWYAFWREKWFILFDIVLVFSGW